MTKDKLIEVLKKAEIITENEVEAGSQPDFDIDPSHFNEYGQYMLKQLGLDLRKRS